MHDQRALWLCGRSDKKALCRLHPKTTWAAYDLLQKRGKSLLWGQSGPRPQGSLSLKTKPAERVVIVTERAGCKTFGVCFFSVGNIDKTRGKKDNPSSQLNFWQKRKCFLAEKEVVWILSCICSACWEMNSSCKQSRSEPDCRTHCGHSSEATFLLVWGHLGFQFKDKSIYRLFFVHASPFPLCKARALGG